MSDKRMKTITIGEMIPEAAWPEIEGLCAAGNGRAEHFLPVLAKYRADMEGRGILPEYAAYALEYAVSQTTRSR